MFSQYVLILVWVGIVAFFAKRVQVNKKVLVEGVEEERVKWLFAFIAFLPVILIAAYRPVYFGDTGAYEMKFLRAPTTFEGIPRYLDSQTKDHGFYLLLCFLLLFRLIL